LNTTDYGFWVLLWTQNDAIGRAIFLVLLVMSMLTWYLILSKGISAWVIRYQTACFLQRFRRTSSLACMSRELASQASRDPFAEVARQAIQAKLQHAQYPCHSPESTAGVTEYVTRSLRRVIDEQIARLENGLTVLATIGSTAPFVGLLGTVWGIYHALLKIAADDSANFSSLAGPVGEALIMTALGLAVAIPAVLAYNALIRLNRVYLAKLDGFAHALLTRLTLGQTVTPTCTPGSGRASTVLGAHNHGI
jgi:biopolymer transport protein ExbB